VTRLPELYVIGAPKSGTTSLAGWLADHPQITFSVPKEPFYWASDYPGMRSHYGFDTRARYAALFASAPEGTMLAEGSTTYLYSERAVPDILAAVPGARFVVALRNPVDLLISWHRTQLVSLNESEADFATAWRRSVAGGMPDTTPLDPKLVDYPRVGRLGAAVERLLAQAPRDRVHVVLLEELSADPEQAWRALADFAGIAADPLPSFDVRNASTKAARFTAVRRITHRPPRLLAGPLRALRQWSRTTSLPAVAALKRRMWRAATLPSVRPEVRAEVAAYLASDVALLSERLGTDLSRWATVPSG